MVPQVDMVSRGVEENQKKSDVGREESSSPRAEERNAGGEKDWGRHAERVSLEIGSPNSWRRGVRTNSMKKRHVS